MPQASQHGNTDATERLAALSQPAPAALSRQEHDTLTETTLVRKRTQAKQRSDASGSSAGPRTGGRPNGQQVIANIRKNSLAHRTPNPGYPPPPVAGPSRIDNPPAGLPPASEGYAHPYRQQSMESPNLNSEGYSRPPQRQPPPQGPPSGSSGFRPLAQPGAGPHLHQSTLPSPPQPHLPPPQPHASLPPQGSGPGPGGYPSPRIQGYGQGARPQSQPGAGPVGPGQRPPLRTGSGSDPAFAGGPGGPGRPIRQTSGPAPPAPYDPPMKPPGPKGPATFEEMGFRSERQEKDGCVIM
jgi:hypothetical protein